MTIYSEALEQAKQDLFDVIKAWADEQNITNREDLGELLVNQDWYDEIHDICDRQTPIYLSDLLEVIRDDTYSMEVGFNEALDLGGSNLINFLQVCFLEGLKSELHENITEIYDEILDSIEEDETEE